MIRKLPILLIFILISLYLGVVSVQAQLSGVEVTASFAIPDTQAVDGDILVMTDKGLQRAAVELDARLFGVLQNTPTINYRPIDNSGKAVARTGIASVNVTTVNGPINPGDFITSSAIPGKGAKTNKAGFVIGVAIDPLAEGQGGTMDYQGKKITTGKISVAMRIEYHDIITGSRSISRMFGPLGSAFFADIQNPDQFTQTIKYAAAGMAFVITILVGFLTFSRSLAKAVEAVGRNPLAKTSIYISIGFNIFFTVVLALIGIAAAFIIIRL